MEKLSVDLIKKTISEARIPIASYAKTGMVKHLYADLYPEENGRVFKVMYKVDWNGRGMYGGPDPIPAIKYYEDLGE